MRIILGIAGEGYGHATRCKPVIEHLKKHELKILTGGKSYEYLSKKQELTKIAVPRLVYANNKLNTTLSGLLTIVKIPAIIYSLGKTFFVFLKFKPDIIINDFEMCTNWMGILFRVPVIHIDNGRIVIEGEIETPKKPFLSFLKVLFWGKILNPSKKYGLIPSFFAIDCKEGNKVVFPPMREEIKKLKPNYGKHILVYQTSKSYGGLIKELEKVDRKFVVYGFDKNEVQKNIAFRKFNEKGFFKDLANCSCVITNGGFSLISESIYLKKPVLSCPVRKQFEQEVNAFYLDKLGYGKKVEFLSAENITEFIGELKRYKRNLNKLEWKDCFLEEMDEIILL
ncbi:MAG: MJ1255/VC2487 family glycosyltransferase [Nanoarchaeota archaeon]